MTALGGGIAIFAVAVLAGFVLDIVGRKLFGGMTITIVDQTAVGVLLRPTSRRLEPDERECRVCDGEKMIEQQGITMAPFSSPPTYDTPCFPCRATGVAHCEWCEDEQAEFEIEFWQNEVLIETLTCADCAESLIHEGVLVDGR